CQFIAETENVAVVYGARGGCEMGPFRHLCGRKVGRVRPHNSCVADSRDIHAPPARAGLECGTSLRSQMSSCILAFFTRRTFARSRTRSPGPRDLETRRM